MSLDLAIDFNTGDLILSPNRDIERRVGVDTIQQRIRVRLRIRQGDWPLDFTGGSLGSRLREALRYPMWRAETEIPMIVREALAPMDDIVVDDVQVAVSGPRTILVSIFFSIIEPMGSPSPTQEQVNLTLGTGG